jgi:hypothetical protein
VVIGAVGVFIKPGMLDGVIRGKVVGPEELKLAEGKVELEYKVLLE